MAPGTEMRTAAKKAGMAEGRSTLRRAVNDDPP
ncbi:unannotated protein [freshwater metagenome]|uniref:Unannotated protein n=1 Tax=freshwater metagenome TaxID=449393 RepID=A0A6J6S9U9_9ZZZZ